MPLAALVANALLQNLAIGIVVVPLLWLGFRRFPCSASMRSAAWAGAIIAAVVFPVALETVTTLSAATLSGPSTTHAFHVRGDANAAGSANAVSSVATHPSTSTPSRHSARSGLASSVPVTVSGGILSALATSWLILALSLLSLLGVKYGLLLAELRRLEPPAADHLVRLAAALDTTGLRRQAGFAVTDTYAAPAVAGLRRPVIIVPSSVLESADSAELQRVVMHEAAHLVRHDDYVDLAVRVALALAFFNPALWAARRLLEIDREIACDDHVVRKRSDRRDYAMLLVRIARGPRPSAGLSLSSSSQQLALRVESIMDEGRNRDLRSLPGIVAAGAIAIVPWLLALTVHVASASPLAVTIGDDAHGSGEQARYLTAMAPGATLHLYNYAGGVRVDEARGDTLSIDGRAVASPEAEWPLMKFSGSTSAPVACAVARAETAAKCGDEAVLEGPAVPSIDWSVSLPAQRGIAIHTGQGTVFVRSSGDVEIRDGQGNIDAAGRSIDAATQHGNIVAKMSSQWLAHSVTLSAQYGMLTLSVPRSLRAQIVATSLSGSIRSSIPLQFDENRGSGVLVGRAVLENATDRQRLVLIAGSSIEITQQ